MLTKKNPSIYIVKYFDNLFLYIDAKALTRENLYNTFTLSLCKFSVLDGSLVLSEDFNGLSFHLALKVSR